MEKDYLKFPGNLSTCGKFLSCQESRIILYIAAFGKKLPSLKEISVGSGISLSTVKRCLNELKKRDLINWEQGSNFKKKTNKYSVDLGEISKRIKKEKKEA